MSGDNPQMRLRLPPELRTQIEEASKTAGRSMNAEIVFRLAETFDKDPFIDIEASRTDLPYGIIARAILLILQSDNKKESSRLLNQLKLVLNTIEGMEYISSVVPQCSKKHQGS